MYPRRMRGIAQEFEWQTAPRGKIKQERKIRAHMPIEKEVKQGTIGKFRTHEKDTGSPEVQIALLTSRIEALTEHFKVHGKDYTSRVGLVKLINTRRKLLNYLKFNGMERYRAVIEKLGLRK